MPGCQLRACRRCFVKQFPGLCVICSCAGTGPWQPNIELIDDLAYEPNRAVVPAHVKHDRRDCFSRPRLTSITKPGVTISPHDGSENLAIGAAAATAAITSLRLPSGEGSKSSGNLETSTASLSNPTIRLSQLTAQT